MKDSPRNWIPSSRTSTRTPRSSCTSTGVVLRQLVVNGDDFGFTHDVNAGIVEACERGFCALPPLWPTARPSTTRSGWRGRLRLWMSAVTWWLVGGPSLARPAPRFPRASPSCFGRSPRAAIAVYQELSAQVRRILDAGLQPSIWTPTSTPICCRTLLEAVARIAEEFRIPWVRRPFQIPLLRRRFRAVLDRHGCRTTIVSRASGSPAACARASWPALIRELPGGSTELMCHPGHCTAELLATRSRLTQSRQSRTRSPHRAPGARSHRAGPRAPIEFPERCSENGSASFFTSSSISIPPSFEAIRCIASIRWPRR